MGYKLKLVPGQELKSFKKSYKKMLVQVFDKNVNISTLSGFMLAQCGVIIFPEQLKTHSEAGLDGIT